MSWKRARVAVELLLDGPGDNPKIDLVGEWQTGLFCGLEDRGLQNDAYEACLFGYERGVEAAIEWMQFHACEAAAALDQPAALSFEKRLLQVTDAQLDIWIEQRAAARCKSLRADLAACDAENKRVVAEVIKLRGLGSQFVDALGVNDDEEE